MKAHFLAVGILACLSLFAYSEKVTPKGEPMKKLSLPERKALSKKTVEELVALLEKMSKESPGIFSLKEADAKRLLGPENLIKILPHLGTGRDIELQVKTGEKNEGTLLCADIATALGISRPKIHRLPVHDGPVYLLSDGKSDNITFKGLQLEIRIGVGNLKVSSGINLRGEGDFYDLHETSDVSYVMVRAPER
jgi:hypothetical protein